MLFKNAYLELMEVGERINVRALCEKAQLNRSTFYLHYSEPEEILKEIEKELAEELKNRFAEIGKNTPEGELNLIRDLLQYIRSNDRIVRLMLLGEQNPAFRREFLQTMKDHIVLAIRTEVNPEYREYLFSYIVNGSLAVITAWIRSGYEKDPRKIADLLRNLASSVLELPEATAAEQGDGIY